MVCDSHEWKRAISIKASSTEGKGDMDTDFEDTAYESYWNKMGFHLRSEMNLVKLKSTRHDLSLWASDKNMECIIRILMRHLQTRIPSEFTCRLAVPKDFIFSDMMSTPRFSMGIWRKKSTFIHPEVFKLRLVKFFF